MGLLACSVDVGRCPGPVTGMAACLSLPSPRQAGRPVMDMMEGCVCTHTLCKAQPEAWSLSEDRGHIAGWGLILRSGQ